MAALGSRRSRRRRRCATWRDERRQLTDASSTHARPVRRRVAARRCSALGEASQIGRQAVKAATPTVALLDAVRVEHAGAGQEPRDRPRAPRRPLARGRDGPALARQGKGYTGLEALLAVRLRPVPGAQHLRQRRLHPEGRRRSWTRLLAPTTTATSCQGRRRMDALTECSAQASAPTARARPTQLRRRDRRLDGRATSRQPAGDAGAPAARRQPTPASSATRVLGDRTGPGGASRPGGDPDRPAQAAHVPVPQVPSCTCPAARRRADDVARGVRTSPRPCTVARTPGGGAADPAREPPSSTTCWRHEARAAPHRSSPTPCSSGAVTVLVVIVAVFLAYNANNGLPFVPTRELTSSSPTAPSSWRATRSARAASASASWTT